MAASAQAAKQKAADLRWMRLALSLGKRGFGQVWPNPAVGCVIVADGPAGAASGGRVVGRGSTAPGGRPHAEVVALTQAGAAARGATAYVTLEPCAHYGKTPPCAGALIAAGIGRVVVALGDPDPRTDGAGIAALEAAGIPVETGVMAEAAARDHRGFILRVTEGRPLLTLKLAASVDGRIATATGESRWITGPEARARVHMLRASHDAVMVGGGTVRADDPMLNVRGLGVARQPVRVILSRRLDLPLGGRLAESARDIPLWLAHGQDAEPAAVAAWTDLGARMIPCDTGPGGQLDPGAALQALGAAGLTRVFCEGGGALAASLLAADLVDDLIVFSAGLALGAEGMPALGAMGLAALDEAPRFRLRKTQAIGGDVMTEWTRP